MPDPIDISRHLTRIQHLERARDTFAAENRALLELLALADRMTAASIIGNGVDFAQARAAYLDARRGPNP